LPTVCDVPCTSANHAAFMHATYFAISRVACAAPPAGRAQSRRAPRRCRRRRTQNRQRCARTSAARAPARAAARARGEGDLSKRPGDAPNWAQTCSRQDAACANNYTLLECARAASLQKTAAPCEPSPHPADDPNASGPTQRRHRGSAPRAPRPPRRPPPRARAARGSAASARRAGTACPAGSERTRCLRL